MSKSRPRRPVEIWTYDSAKTTTFVRGRRNFSRRFWSLFIFSPAKVIQTKIPNFRETGACKAYAYRNSFINEPEFVLLYDLHKSKNPEFPYWNYERFDLDEKTNDECKAGFRFNREDIYRLAEQLQLPDEITTYTGLVVASVPALCMHLKRYAYPCRYGDLLYHLADPVSYTHLTLPTKLEV